MEQQSSLVGKISGAACNIKHILENAEIPQVTLKAEPNIEENRITCTSNPCEQSLIL